MSELDELDMSEREWRERCKVLAEQERALEAAVVEAALQWHDPLHHDDAAPWENALDDACAALRAFRDTRARGEK